MITGAFVLYLLVGPYMPGFLYHQDFSFRKMIEVMYLLTDEGIDGVITNVSATFAYVFVLFVGMAYLLTIGWTAIMAGFWIVVLAIGSSYLGLHWNTSSSKLNVMATLFVQGLEDAGSYFTG